MDTKESRELDTLETLLTCERKEVPKLEENINDRLSTSSVNSETNLTKREEWSHGLDFILSLLGYAVGLGNLWRFPYLCMRNGGGAFLIPFIFFVVTCGMPLFYLEVSVGQFLGKSCIQAWVVCPIFKGLGIGMILMTAILCCYYNMILGWALYYLGNSFRSPLPWSDCDGWWTTDHCYVKASVRENVSQPVMTNGTGTLSAVNYTQLDILHPAMNKTNLRTSEEEFWQNNVLQISPGLESMGSLSWYLTLSLFGAWVIVFFCIIKGVKSIGKVVYVTAIAPYILLTILLIRGATLPGAADGILYYLKPDLKRMMRVQVWVEAALQVFFSLGPGWGPLITMASYNKFNNNCLRDSLLVPFIGEGTSIFSGLVVFTILGFIAHDLGMPIEEVVKSGPGLGFVAYPQALARLPLPQFWSVLFFLMLITVGLDSQFTSAEAVLAAILDSFPRLRKRRVFVTALVCMVGFILGLSFCFQGGIYLFQLVDWYIAIICVPVFGIIECVIFAWIYGAERFSRDVELMLGRGVPVFMRICWCFITPAALLLCLIFTMMTYKPPSYGNYDYPAFAQALGWLIAALPLIPVISLAVYQLYKTRKLSYLQRLLYNLRPSPEWRPHCEKGNGSYENFRYEYRTRSIIQRIRVNVFGDNT